MRGGGKGRRSFAWGGGVFLGFAGAILDFFSSYLILAQSTASEMGTMAGPSSSGIIWGIGIATLGVLLAVTSFALVLPVSGARMGEFGALMVAYGLVMLFIGASMYSGITAMANGALFPAVAMFVFGTLMIVNGVLMRRPHVQPAVP